MNNTANPETKNSHASDEERLAQLMGFQAELNSEPSAPLLSEEELEDKKTKHPFVSRPDVKLIAVGLGMLILVGLVSIFFSGVQSSPNRDPSQKEESNKEKENLLVSPPEEDREKGEIKSALALQEQKERIKDINDELNQPKKPLTMGDNRAKNRTMVPPQQTAAIGIPERRTSSRVIPVTPTVVVRPSLARQQQFLASAPRPMGIPASVTRSQATSSQDPFQEWGQLAQIGSYSPSEVAKTRTSSVREQQRPIYTPPSSVVNRSDEFRGEIPTPSSPNANREGISFGQAVSAVLETPIAWEGSRGRRQGEPSPERYLIGLKEPLKDGFGQPQIPAGAQLIVRLSSSSNALVTLTVESVVVNGVESKLPSGSLTIRGAENQPLMAQMQEIGGDSGINFDILPDLLSIAGDFADIPGGRSVDRMFRLVNGGGRTRQGGFTTTIFFLPQGTPLEVFVNKTFSLNNQPSAPLELDLGASDSPQQVATQQTEAGESTPISPVTPSEFN